MTRTTPPRPLGPGDVINAYGDGTLGQVDTPGLSELEVELFPGEELDLDKVREALDDIFHGQYGAWQLLDDGTPGVYSEDDTDELVDTMASRPGTYTVAKLKTRGACHKCSDADCHFTTEAEAAGLLLLEPDT